MIMAPFTGARSASSALRTSSLYQAEKSSPCGVTPRPLRSAMRAQGTGEALSPRGGMRAGSAVGRLNVPPELSEEPVELVGREHLALDGQRQPGLQHLELRECFEVAVEVEETVLDFRRRHDGLVTQVAAPRVDAVKRVCHDISSIPHPRRYRTHPRGAGAVGGPARRRRRGGDLRALPTVGGGRVYRP